MSGSSAKGGKIMSRAVILLSWNDFCNFVISGTSVSLYWKPPSSLSESAEFIEAQIYSSVVCLFHPVSLYSSKTF